MFLVYLMMWAMIIPSFSLESKVDEGFIAEPHLKGTIINSNSRSIKNFLLQHLQYGKTEEPAVEEPSV